VREKHGYEPESFTALRRRLGWRFHVGILALVAAQGSAILYWCPRYYWSSAASNAAVGAMLLRFWAFRRRVWFWMAMAPMTLIQVPLIIVSNDTANRYRGEFVFLVTLADFLVMNAVVGWICPKPQ
jgi:hypothetical protein